MSSNLLHIPNAMEVNAYEARTKRSDRFLVPNRYDTDTLKTMVVNPFKIYCYWELTHHLLVSSGGEGRPLYVSLESEEGDELCRIGIDSLCGAYYFDGEFDHRSLLCNAFFLDDQNHKIVLLRSNTVITPSLTLSPEALEEGTWMQKEEGWSELIRYSLTATPSTYSSRSLVEEISMMRKFGLQTFSSGEIRKEKR